MVPLPHRAFNIRPIVHNGPLFDLARATMRQSRRRSTSAPRQLASVTRCGSVRTVWQIRLSQTSHLTGVDSGFERVILSNIIQSATRMVKSYPRPKLRTIVLLLGHEHCDLCVFEQYVSVLVYCIFLLHF